MVNSKGMAMVGAETATTAGITATVVGIAAGITVGVVGTTAVEVATDVGISRLRY